MRPLLMLAVALLLAPSALATVDLIAPAAGAALPTPTVTFEYYVSMTGLVQCTLTADGQQFPDTDVQGNAINSIQVQNVAAGLHAWNVTCAGDAAEISATRAFRVDTQAPAVAVVSPANASVAGKLAIDIIPSDDQDALIACDLTWDGQPLDSAQVASATHHARNYTVSPGTGVLGVSCADDAGNAAGASRTVTIDAPLALSLRTDRAEYGIHEQVLLTVDTQPGANVTIDICPNQQGFVQCTSALLDTSAFPQTVTLPYMNRTGEYLVDGIVRYGNKTATNRTTYEIVNTLSIDVPGREAYPNETVTFTASVSGGAPPYQLSWKLPNGTAIAGVSSVDVSERNPGRHNVTVTATDSAGNARSLNATLTVLEAYDITLTVLDNATGLPIAGASVEIGGGQASSGADGRAFLTIDAGTQQLFVSAAGYAYLLEEIEVNASDPITVRLNPTSAALAVTLFGPASGSTLGTPVTVRYSVSSPSSCTLLLSTDGTWFAENGTVSVPDTREHEFVRALAPGAYTVRVECRDGSGVRGASEDRAFTVVEGGEVSAATPLAEEVELQNLDQHLSSLVDQLASYPADAQQAAKLLEFDKRLRNAKRAVQQAIRDLDSLRYRTDLDAAAQAAERARIIEAARAAAAGTPERLEVLDTRSYSRYVEEEDMPQVAAELAGLAGMLDDPKRLGKLLLPEQQRFTVSTKLWHVRYGYAAGEETVTLVTRTFTYADDLDEGYGVVEIIPKQVVASAKDIDLITQADVLRDDPVLRFPAGGAVSYVIPKKVDFDRLQTVRTVLAPRYVQDEVTGFAILGEGMDVGGVPILWLAALGVLAYLAYYFNLARQVRYLVYLMGKNEQVHYLRVLMRDADDHLAAGNYEKAEMLYKEVRLTYDTLSELARNDLYEEVMDLVRKMDAYYFNLVMIEIDSHLKAGDMRAAIEAYEKLAGTFERLDDERKRQLVETVTAIARRVGVSA